MPLSLAGDRQRLLDAVLERRGLRRRATCIPPRPAGHPVPLSLAQEQLWLLDQLEPERALSNVPGTVRLVGPLDSLAFRHALEALGERHETLRTSFQVVDGRAIQVVASPGTIDLKITDLRALSKPTALEEARRLATDEANRPFALARPPLFRSRLVRVADDEHVFLLNLHHLITDGWSMGVLTRELGELYSAAVTGSESRLADLPIQFADFAFWQRQRAENVSAPEVLEYWRRTLDGFVPFDLPSDRPRPAIQSFRGRHHAVRLSAELSAALREFSRSERATLFMTLAAGFKTVLAARSNRTDVVVGSTFSERDRTELEGLIGYLVNLVVLRTELAGDPSFRRLVARVRETTLGALTHREVPLSALLRMLGVQRDPARNPLVQIEFSLFTPDRNPAVYGYGLGSGPLEELRLGGLVVNTLDVDYPISRFDLALFLWDLPDRIAGAFEYATDLFEPATIAAIARDFQELLRAAMEYPDAPISVLVNRLESGGHVRGRREAYRDAVLGHLARLRPR